MLGLLDDEREGDGRSKHGVQDGLCVWIGIERGFEERGECGGGEGVDGSGLESRSEGRIEWKTGVGRGRESDCNDVETWRSRPKVAG